MDCAAQCDLGQEEEIRSVSKSASCSGSDSGSTEESERLRRLFHTCDRDGDGYIDSHDLVVICRQLNMEDAVDEIMQQLCGDEQGRISYDEFVNCRMQLVTEIEHERMRERGLANQPPPRPPKKHAMWGQESRAGQGSRTAAQVRDLDMESHSLYKLMESHDAEALHRMIEVSDTMQGQQGGSNFLDVANSLHLAALTSLKGEILDLSNRLQHVSAEKDVLEKQLSKQQAEKLRIQRDAEDRFEQQTARYEERITELHSVIAELRKKIDRHQINVIREEEEYEESEDVPSNKSNDEPSVNENNAESQSASLVDIGNDLNAEFSRVVSELENAIGEHKKIAADAHSESLAEHFAANNTVEEKTIQDMENFHIGPSLMQYEQSNIGEYEEEIQGLKAENAATKEQVARQEAELNRLKAQLGSIREERDRLKRRVRELQTRVQSLEASTSPHNSRTSTPTKSQAVNPTTGERTVSVSSTEQQQAVAPVTKVAGLKKLRTASSERHHVLGAEISSVGLPNSKVAEHLVQNLQDSSSVQEISQTLYQGGNEIENKVQEFEIEFERLTSKIDHLKSQNDLLTLTLEESKAHTDRLSVLIGKYESNNTALQLAISYSDQALEAYEVLTSLMESEKGMLLASCRAAGLGSNVGGSGDVGELQDQEEVTAILQKAHLARKASENIAKQLLQRLDRSCGVQVPTCSASPWEELSSNSRTASTTSSTSSSADTEFSKVDEQKLRDYIQQLKNDRGAVKMTVMELESVHIDPFVAEPGPNPDAHRLDLENAVLMQELMAIKEEKAELKAQNYLMEKEKAALELQLSSKQSREQAYLVQIEHLKCEVKEQQQRMNKWGKKEEGVDSATPAITLAELRSHDASDIARDLSEALRRENKLKARVQELVTTLEKLSKNSEIRHQQSAEFVNDLKRANSTLIRAFEKAKKKVPTATLR